MNISLLNSKSGSHYYTNLKITNYLKSIYHAIPIEKYMGNSTTTYWENIRKCWTFNQFLLDILNLVFEAVLTNVLFLFPLHCVMSNLSFCENFIKMRMTSEWIIIKI